MSIDTYNKPQDVDTKASKYTIYSIYISDLTKTATTRSVLIAAIKQVRLSQFRYDYHPLTKLLLRRERFELGSHDTLTPLHDEQIATLLDALILPVSLSGQTDPYQLLMPVPLFELIKCHPYAQHLNVTLRLYDDPLQAIPTLMLTGPALHHRVKTTTLSQLAQRLAAAKTTPSPFNVTYPKKSTLAKLANVNPSAIRITTTTPASHKESCDV
ncbi:hypothetical protein VTH8203_03395 [Vibrio thalassae]|uniref:Uncharacterized protein n=1 Tax=Vibrio thalassae TaxID=1243014 RepID=A0A240EM28_9VIBR|nr:hypothetical protein [Vibrio thalassae]SNX49747.1 hypothetical protein VTH8203_03395 [Vibrio thalassae]